MAAFRLSLALFFVMVLFLFASRGAGGRRKRIDLGSPAFLCAVSRSAPAALGTAGLCPTPHSSPNLPLWRETT